MKISVYITSYNQKFLLGEAIESVLAQTLKPAEIIIVDDSSTDGSQELIASYCSIYPDRIVPIYHSQNRGIALSRIDALQKVSGDYVTYLDGDDRYLPTKLEKEAALLLKNSDAQIAFSNNHYISIDGSRIGRWADDNELPPQGYVFCQTFARDFPKGNLFRMELIEYGYWKKIGFHDSNLSMYEDYDMRIRLTKYLKTVYKNELLTEIRRHNKGLSNAPAAEHLKAFEYIYRKNAPLLFDLSAGERKRVEKSLHDWMARFAMRAAREAMAGKGSNLLNIKQILNYYTKMLKCRFDFF